MKKRTRSTERTYLLEGCYCSNFSVHPENWDKPGASVKEDWYIHYRFYDPAFRNHPKYGNGKPCPVKGMNKFKTLTERREVTKALLEQEKDLIIAQGWNPLRQLFMKVDDIEETTTISPKLNLVDALDAAAKTKSGDDKLKENFRSVLKYFKQAAASVRVEEKLLSTWPVGEIRKRHIRAILDKCGVLKGDKWTANNFNYYRAHLQMLFNELMEHDAVEHNYLDDISRRKKTRKRRKLLTPAETQKVDLMLRANNPRLWLIVNIFYHSGSRTTEFMKVKKEDVDFDRRVVKYTVKKGGSYREVERPMKEISVLLWLAAVRDALPGQYLFSRGLRPGNDTIRTEQVGRRWKRWVKDPYNIEADWYTLKHLNTTQMADEYGIAVPAALNEHSPEVAEEFYDMNARKRKDTIIRGATNTFVQVA